jgi:hypothetical protein
MSSMFPMRSSYFERTLWCLLCAGAAATAGQLPSYFAPVEPVETAAARAIRVEAENRKFMTHLVRLVAKGKVDFSFFSDEDARYELLVGAARGNQMLIVTFVII